MPSLDSYTHLPVRMSIYGDTGTGKTYALGKLAEKYKIHYLALENGQQTLADPKCVLPEFRKNVQVYTIVDTNEAPRAQIFMHNLLTTGKITACEAHGSANCAICATSTTKKEYTLALSSLGISDILVVDSMTQWDRSIRAMISKKHNVDWMAESAKDMHGANNMMRFYDALAHTWTGHLSRIQALQNTNIICISHTRDTSKLDPSGKVVKKGRIVPAGGSANTAESNASFFSDVIFSYKENNAFKFASNPLQLAGVDAKSRTGFDCAGKDPRLALFELFQKSVPTV